MSPKGVCGLSTEATVQLDMSEDEDRTTLKLWFQWDGTSLWPNCRGSLTSLELKNWHDEPWEAVFNSEADEADQIVFPMGANSEQTISGPTLAARGLSDLPDIGGVLMRAVAE